MRLGLYVDKEFTTYTLLKDWADTGIQFKLIKSGLNCAPYTLTCITEGTSYYADLAARADLLGIPGARMFTPDVGISGCLWVVVNGTWMPLTTIYGNGSPETVVTAPIGSLYCRLNGGASTTLYVKESGTGNTGWVAK